MKKPTLVGVDGNAFCVMGYVSKELKRAGLGNLVTEYTSKATSSNYDNLLCVSMDYLDKAIEAREASPDFPGWEDD